MISLLYHRYILTYLNVPYYTSLDTPRLDQYTIDHIGCISLRTTDVSFRTSTYSYIPPAGSSATEIIDKLNEQKLQDGVPIKKRKEGGLVGIPKARQLSNKGYKSRKNDREGGAMHGTHMVHYGIRMISWPHLRYCLIYYDTYLIRLGRTCDPEPHRHDEVGVRPPVARQHARAHR